MSDDPAIQDEIHVVPVGAYASGPPAQFLGLMGRHDIPEGRCTIALILDGPQSVAAIGKSHILARTGNIPVKLPHQRLYLKDRPFALP